MAGAGVIVLCGGSGRRAGGVDKPLLELAGQPLIAHLHRRLGEVGPMIISANRNISRYARFGRVVRDRHPTRSGPLAGIAACLPHVAGDYAFVCPSDCPLVSATLARRLLEVLAAAPPEVAAVCAHDGERRQPLHTALRKTCVATIENCLSEGAHSVLAWLDRAGAIEVACDDLAEAFLDVDDVADLGRLARRLETRDSG